VQLALDGLGACSGRTDARSDRVDVRVMAHDRDLGAVPRLARDALDLDDALLDLGDLEREQPDDERRVGARADDLRAAQLLAHLDDDGPRVGAVREPLVGDLLRVRQQRLGATELEQRDVALLGDLAGDDVALVADELAVGDLPLRLAQTLQQHLLGGLGDDATEVARLVDPLVDDVALVVELLGVQGHLARDAVDGDARLVGTRGRRALVGGRERTLERVDDRQEVDALLTLDLPQRLDVDLHRSPSSTSTLTRGARAARTRPGRARPALGSAPPTAIHDRSVLHRDQPAAQRPVRVPGPVHELDVAAEVAHEVLRGDERALDPGELTSSVASSATTPPRRAPRRAHATGRR
jgi:hypothetical protein